MNTYEVKLGYLTHGSPVISKTLFVKAAGKQMASAKAGVLLAREVTGDLEIIMVAVKGGDDTVAEQDGYAGGRQSGKARRDMYMAGGDMIVDKKRR